ncbi:PrsW family glutamic-type intramembrane protease [Patescibacteria group bacterium]
MYAGTIALIVFSLAPVALLLWYFDRQDQHKESRRFLWSIFLWGVLVTFLAGGIEYFLNSFIGGIFYSSFINILILAFVYTALVEEAFKYWVVKKKAYDHPAFNEYYDGVIYAVVASLGFAALENVFYVIEGGLYVGVIRAILAVPAHALFGAIMGYYIGIARFEKNREKEKKLLSTGLLLAVLFHGIYDFFLMSETILAVLVIPMILALYLNVRRKIKHLHVLDNIQGAVMPLKWTWKNYLKVSFGLGFFTIGVLTLFTVVLFVTNDPITLEAFADIEFDVTGSLIFAFIMWIFSFLLVYRNERIPKKNR